MVREQSAFMWLEPQERLTLGLLGGLALLGLGVLLWQRPPLVVEGALNAMQVPRWDEVLAVARQVDINTASAAELERLPEIGPGLAKRIVEYRQQHGRFKMSEELRRVRGIGPKKYKALEGYVR